MRLEDTDILHLRRIVLCGIYYVFWIYLLPWLRNYRIRSEVLSLDGSAATHKLVKVSVKELAAWDSTHDVSGRLIVDRSEKEGSDKEDYAEVFKTA